MKEGGGRREEGTVCFVLDDTGTEKRLERREIIERGGDRWKRGEGKEGDGLEVAYAAALRRTSDAVTQRAEMDQHHGLETRKVSAPTTKAHRPRAQCARDVERAQALDV